MISVKKVRSMNIKTPFMCFLKYILKRFGRPHTKVFTVDTTEEELAGSLDVGVDYFSISLQACTL